MIIKNLDYVFTESKASQKHSSTFSSKPKFLLSFYNTKCNEINHMVALRMDLVFIDIHTYISSASRAMFVILQLHEQGYSIASA